MQRPGGDALVPFKPLLALLGYGMKRGFGEKFNREVGKPDFVEEVVLKTWVGSSKYIRMPTSIVFFDVIK